MSRSPRTRLGESDGQPLVQLSAAGVARRDWRGEPRGWQIARRPIAAVLVWALASGASAVHADRPAPPRLRAEGIDGALVISGGDKVPEAVARRFIELAGGAKASVVVLALREADRKAAEEDVKTWTGHHAASVRLRLLAEPAGAAAETSTLAKATGVWLVGHAPASLLDGSESAAVQTRALATELHDVLQHGGVIGGRSIAAAMLARWTSDEDQADKPVAGLDLLPGMLVMPDFLHTDAKIHLVRLLRAQPDAVGLGIGDQAGLVVQGRQMHAVGEGSVTIRLAASATHEAQTAELAGRNLADLTQLRRAAIARQSPPYPPKQPRAPQVPRGSLIIVGGGGMPADVTKRFIDLAGGPDALIVLLPTANPDPLSPDAGVGLLRREGAKNVKVLPARELKEVEDPKNLDVLRQAKGIWFGGGRQWRFVDAYENTKAHELFREVLQRGGVIGGSSAGATIQGDYLCRGSPINNTDMVCEGYERGLGFLAGVAIDQHFAQRNRFADMTALVKTYPQLLGIGLDEATAIVVQGTTAEVMGRGEVHFYDRRKDPSDGQQDHESLKAGERYDLKARSTLRAARDKVERPKSGGS